MQVIKQGNNVAVILEGETDVAAFTQLVTRGANCWDTAPAEIVNMYDIFVSGKPLMEVQPIYE